MQNTPIVVLSQNVRRETGRKVQLDNVQASKAVADVVRTCLGPKAMLKMLMDPMGGIVMTNDGNAILREITVQHPAAKNLIEIARTQDEEVGDGTTSVIILTGEMMAAAEPFLIKQIHPGTIIRAYRTALTDILNIMNEKYSIPVESVDSEYTMNVVKNSIGTKISNKWGDFLCKIAIDAVSKVIDHSSGEPQIDIKRNIRIEKVPGETIEDSALLDGIMLNKDVTHGGMRRSINNPRIILLDCPLEYKKGESQTNVEITDEKQFTRLLELEEESIKKLCGDIIALKPDVVFTEKGISDLAQHYLLKAGITAVRRVKKTDNQRLARACGATIMYKTEDLTEEHVGLQAGLFEVKKIGDEYFTFVTKCKNPKACTIVLRGASKDLINEVERNLQDAIRTAKNLIINPKLVLGGGCLEMHLARDLLEKSNLLPGSLQGPYRAVANALKVIPRTLAMNCGENVMKLLTTLNVQQINGDVNCGIDGETGALVDVLKAHIYEPLMVKEQVFKTAIETAIMLLRIDDIVSGSKKKDSSNAPAAAQPTEESMKE